MKSLSGANSVLSLSVNKQTYAMKAMKSGQQLAMVESLKPHTVTKCVHLSKEKGIIVLQLIKLQVDWAEMGIKPVTSGTAITYAAYSYNLILFFQPLSKCHR